MSKTWKLRTCGRCPKWGDGYCRIAAKMMVAAHPACDYGAKKINSHDTAVRARRRGKNFSRVEVEKM